MRCLAKVEPDRVFARIVMWALIAMTWWWWSFYVIDMIHQFQ